uniref:protein-tyrosine-phosphatase n=1 Tax=Globodera rostochiensis TaxID=31243 RepID=A0A914HHY4_GLORO
MTRRSSDDDDETPMDWGSVGSGHSAHLNVNVCGGGGVLGMPMDVGGAKTLVPVWVISHSCRHRISSSRIRGQKSSAFIDLGPAEGLANNPPHMEVDATNSTDIEMESCVHVEDPDSRDSGISLAQSTTSQQSWSSQSTITNAVGAVGLYGNDDEGTAKENLDQFDEDSTDELAFQSQCVDRSPIKKRQKSTNRRHKPTDFSSFRQNKCDRVGKELAKTQETVTDKVQQNPELSKPLGLSMSHDTYENWLCPLSGYHRFTSSFVGASSSSSSCSTIASLRTQFDANDALSFSRLSSSSENDLPPSIRPIIHRVHSTPVLECSSDRSWGSPDVSKDYELITVEKPQVPHKAFRSIDANTLKILFDELTKEQFQRRFILIDCRYPYEYDAGHIWYSLNMWETSSIEEIFYPEDEERFGEIKARIPIFYCEYSQKRGPKMALALREHDRKRNESHYPKLDYKQIYILDQGYRQFFMDKDDKFSKYCTPQAYVQMWDLAYTEQRKCYDSHRRGKKRQRKDN